MIFYKNKIKWSRPHRSDIFYSHIHVMINYSFSYASRPLSNSDSDIGYYEVIVTCTKSNLPIDVSGNIFGAIAGGE